MRFIEYFVLILTLIIVLGSIAYAAFKFFKMPKKEQYEKVREWLLYACLKAEKKFGSKTGLIKLRYVYDLFAKIFPWLVPIISFEYFKYLVDLALDEMKKELDKNPKLLDSIDIGAD